MTVTNFFRRIVKLVRFVLAGIYLLLSSSIMVFSQDKIDRFSLVNRHNVSVSKVDPLSPLSVGNGDFAFTADVTGLQSFEDYYHKNGIALETRTTWAWHSFPNLNHLRLEDAMKGENFHGRTIMYASLEKSLAGEYFARTRILLLWVRSAL